ncbi:MAG TPA: RIO1 family regulatory kinase/ATPase [Thermoplasmata archaeon]|nr:RIO1 family regulatory kinase/ATPase [Thermoplasmata archaeon]
MPNNHYLDSSVHWKVRSGTASFSEPRYAETAEAILACGIATEVLRKIGSGKEADVFACVDGSIPVAVKVYRLYRTSHRGGGALKQESMGHQSGHEIEMLTLAWRGGTRVPEPGRRVENMFSMELVGDGREPAPRMSDVEPHDPEQFRTRVLEQVRRLAESGVVHTDLSPFNVLYHHREPWIIDLGQAVRVDRLGMPPWVRLQKAKDALGHGLRTFDRYFRRWGERVEVEEELGSILAELDRRGVLS